MTTTRRIHRAALALCACALALIAACGSKGGSTVAPLAAGTTTSSAAATTGPTTVAATTSSPGSVTGPTAPATSVAPAGAAVTTPLPAVTARSIRYRQFTVAVSRAVTSRVAPDAFDKPSPAAGDATYLYVEVAVTNRVSFASQFVAGDEVRLVRPTGDPIAMADAVGAATDIVDGGATNRGWFAFAVPAGFAVDGAALVFGGAGTQTERLPLTGTPPAPAWPKPVTLRSPGTLRLPHDGSATAATWTVDVTIDEASLDDAVAFDRGRESKVTKQALAGRRWLYLAFTAKLTATSAPNVTSEVLGYDVARLVVNGERQSGAAEVSDSQILEVGTPYHGVYVFDVPTTGTVQLEWGTGADAVRIDVPVS